MLYVSFPEKCFSTGEVEATYPKTKTIGTAQVEKESMVSNRFFCSEYDPTQPPTFQMNSKNAEHPKNIVSMQMEKIFEK